MNNRELVMQALGRLSESDLDDVLEFLRTLNPESVDMAMPVLAAESALAKDWLTPEEEAAWVDL